MKRVLVTGAGGSAAANFVTSLRLAPEKFWIVGTDVKPYHLELARVNRRFLVPPITDKSYLKILNGIIEKEKIELVHPQPDAEVLFLSQNRHKIKTSLFLPREQTIETSQNKLGLIKLLGRHNVPVAQSFFFKNPRELEKYFRVIKKNHRKIWLRAIRGAGSKASLPVKELGQAKSWVEYWQKMKGVGYGDFMISEFLPGRDFAFQSLWNRGRLITCQARERLEYIFGHLTPSGQTSSPSVARTVHNEDVNKISTEAVQALDPLATGIFCVDLKENSLGRPCVTEVNAGRFFTTNNFFSQAGANMPYYYVKLALGEKLPRIDQYNPIPANWYWVRMIDMGYKLVKNESWRIQSL